MSIHNDISITYTVLNNTIKDGMKKMFELRILIKAKTINKLTMHSFTMPVTTLNKLSLLCEECPICLQIQINDPNSFLWDSYKSIFVKVTGSKLQSNNFVVDILTFLAYLVNLSHSLIMIYNRFLYRLWPKPQILAIWPNAFLLVGGFTFSFLMGDRF